MHPTQNPSEEQIKTLVALSKIKAAKWLKDRKNGDLWYWPADHFDTHAKIAKSLNINDYEKGVAVQDCSGELFKVRG